MSSRRFYQALSELVHDPEADQVFEELARVTIGALVALLAGEPDTADELLKDAKGRALLQSALGRDWEP